MLTRQDFTTAVENSLSKYPDLLARYKISDPVFMRQLDAIFTALAMKSAEDEVALAEPQQKTRPATVLADAAVRGIIPKATPARFTISVSNDGESAYTLDSGRIVIDANGLPYIVETGAVVAAGETGEARVKQIEYSVIEHTVAESSPFYFIQVPASESDAALASVAVDCGDIAYRNAQEYLNVSPGDTAYHIEVDGQQNIYVRFGVDGIIGVQPDVGDVFTLTVGYSMGEVELSVGLPFVFDYVSSMADTAVTMTMASLIEAGTSPLSISYLRELCKYPALYDEDAVYLGEFEFLIRKHFPQLKYLSVWNEAVEEDARGANTDNINRLFIACHYSEEATLNEPDSASPVAPERIYSSDWTGTQSAIANKLERADDTLTPVFYTPIVSPLSITVDASVPSSYVASTVKGLIVEALLNAYGIDSAPAKKGRNQPKNRDAGNMLEKAVPALSDSGSDFTVVIGAFSGSDRPELWRYATEDSITVNVDTKNTSATAWGG